MKTTEEATKELKEKLPKRPIEIARDTLRTLSEEVKDLVEDGTFATVNDAIMETLYKTDGHHTFNSFIGWKRSGMQVKKGEKAFLLWSKPKEVPRTMEREQAEEENVEDMYRFYGIAYLFSNKQVELIPTAQAEEQKPAEEPYNLQPLMYDEIEK